MKQKQKTPVSAIVFYVFSVVLLLIFAFQVYYSYEYISGYDLDFSTEWKAILSVYFGQCVLPFIGAVVVYGIGLIITKLPSIETPVVEAVSVAPMVEDEATKDLVNSLKEVKAETKTKKKDAEVKSEEKNEKVEKPVAKKAPAKKATKVNKEETEKEKAEKKEIEKAEKEKIEG